MSDASTGVVVVGGGISGLAAACRLADAGASFLLVEAAPRLGGKILTERIGEFIIEGGPDCFLSSKPDGLGLVRQLGLDGRLVATDPGHRGSFVRRGALLHPLPEGLSGLVPTRVLPLLTTRTLSLLGRARAGLEALLPRRNAIGDESVAAFARRRFGREAYDWLIEPLLSGIYAGDGDQLSLAATFPTLSQLERTTGSVLRAMARRKRPVGGGFVTLRGGLGEMVDAIARRLPGERIRLDAPVTAIERSGPSYRVRVSGGSTITCERVILALPAAAAAPLVAPLDQRIAQELAGIPFVSTATVSLGFAPGALDRHLQGYGFVSPRAVGGPIVAATWTSNKFPGRAPPGGTLLRFFMGRAGSESVLDQPDDHLVALARAQLHTLCGVTATPTIVRVFRWPRSMPQYVVGHLDRLERLAQLTRACPGLLFAGASYRGVGIPDCIASGWATAASALQQLGAAA
ncbi:MAG TPA: protoporphyrinogen oxidase [Gemmatimonadales bacterium]